MKAFLLYKDRDFNFQQQLLWNEQALTQDLELDILVNAMAQGDKFLFEVGKKVILSSDNFDPDSVIYRQNILKDCIKYAAVVREIYSITVEAIEKEKKNYLSIITRYPSYILHRSIEVMQMFMGALKKIKMIADQNIDLFESEGFRNFFSMLQRELDDEYFAIVQEHLKESKFRNGVLISAELGRANKGINYMLRRPLKSKNHWVKEIFTAKPPVYSFFISDRDENGARALSDLKNRGINLIANALAQSNDHILSFLVMLRTELAFYIGCLNLYEQLIQKGYPVCFPVPENFSERALTFKRLYDICLALVMEQNVVDNDLEADHKELLVITGANQGGKSTFMRSIGLAQMMMHCGMFSPAEYFRANLSDCLFTHFKREEDASMKSGKLDEELSRMNEIVDKISSNSMILFNESFAATNEREGSEIARQIITPLLENRIKVIFVTHLYDFANRCFNKKMDNAIFLRAERQENGGRTFKIKEGEPLETSFGEDVYIKLVGSVD